MAAAVLVAPHPSTLALGPLRDACSELLHVDLRLSDVLTLAAAVAGRRDLAAAWRGARRSVRWLLVVGAALALVAFAVHPSWVGVETLLRWGATAAVAAVAVRRWRAGEGHLWLAALLATTVLQAVLGLAQILAGPEAAVPFAGASGWTAGTSTLARGSMLHPYGLGVLALVACAAALRLAPSTVLRPAAVPVACVAAAVATLTYGRAIALGLGVLVVGAAFAGRRRAAAPAALPRWTAAALLVSIAVPALAFGDGWVDRAATTVDAPAAEATSRRDERTSEALGLIRSEPWFGVGPGRYGSALAEREGLDVRDPATCPLPAHDLPLQGAAEAGLPFGALLAGALGAAVVAVLRKARRDPLRAATVVSMVPMLLLDAPYQHAQTLVVLAVWVAVAWCPLQPGTVGEGPSGERADERGPAPPVSPPLGAPASGR